MTGKTVHQVLKEHVDSWSAVHGFVAAGVGEIDGVPCIRVFVAELTDAVQTQFPSVLEGFRVVVEQSGTLRALT